MASTCLSFQLEPTFIEKVKKWPKAFTSQRIDELVYERTYSRVKSDDENEEFHETIKRVVEGCYSDQKDHIKGLNKNWDDNIAQQSAQEMYERMYKMKFLPPGRGLWVSGTPVHREKKLGMAANNCAFISTENILDDPTRPFTTLMDMSMCGTGVGFDTKGANKVRLYEPIITPNQLGLTYCTIPDTREGWVQSLEVLLNSYFYEGSPDVVFNYDEIRKKGEKLKTFGGVSSGPEPLMELHGKIYGVMRREMERQSDVPVLTSTGITDICNLIGVCVVSGGIRRTALIGFGEKDDKEFLDLKNYEKNPHRASYGWTSNNSIFATVGQDYKDIQERICKNGEPGLAWLENMQKYSRMCDPPDWKDRRARGGNPCLEQTLEPYEVCCLVENFIARHDSLEDYLRTQKFSYLFAKTVTLQMTHISETNAVIIANRRIGSSISGIAQFLGKNNIETLRKWIMAAYDRIEHWDNIYSDWFEVPKSIKKTSIKPSGTVSLLAGATPGVHFPHSRYYIRTVRINTGNPLIEKLQKEGYHIEPCQFNPKHTQIVSFPMDIGECKTLDDVTMHEQLELAAFMQQYYADNQVSCTVTFRKEEGQHIAAALDTYQYRLKGISFLPRSDDVYPQMPYQKITKEKYDEECKNIIQRRNGNDEPSPKRRRTEDPDATAFCDGETCQLNL